jgi:hypothetical protein
LALVAATCTADAGHLRKVWEFNLDGVASAPSIGVFALSFSPDGRRILAVAGKSWRDEFVVILDTSAPQGYQKRLDVNPEIWELEPASNFPPGGNSIRWSASGRQVLLGHLMVDLTSGNSCSLPEVALEPGYFFVGPTQIVGPTLGRAGPLPRFSFFNLKCQHAETTDLGTDSDLLDVSADRGFLCLRQDRAGNTTPRSVLVMEASSRKIIRRLPWSITAKFADSGNSVCGVGGTNWHRTVSCSDDTGKMFGETSGWSAVDIRTALHAKRAILSDYGRKLDWIDFFWALGSFKRRAVWDFDTGKELVSWHPKSQTVLTGDYQNIGHREPYRFAISPDADYVIEGGAGSVALYKIEP